MNVGTKVILKQFNGEYYAPANLDPAENYWLLIGKTGKVVKSENSNSRVLVQFEENVRDLGLHCHNEITNSLLILTDDLEAI